MRKTFYLLLLVFFSSFTVSAETITFSGKITNTENLKVRIKGDLLDTEIELKPDGSFLEKLQIENDGIYILETGKNSVPVYLTKTSVLTINFNDNSLATSLKYSGKGSFENQYLAKKQLILAGIPEADLYALDENQFLKKLGEIKSSILALYNKTKFTDKNFKEKEARNINFLEQRRLLSYKKDHWYYGKVSGFQVSETYPKFDETIDLDNNSDFLFSRDYQELVIIKFYQNIKIDSTEYFISAKNAIPEIKALKSPSIKNHLIKYSVTDVNIINSNYETIYHEFSSIVTDPKIKEKLTTQFLVADALKPGSPSPKFDYENQKGGKTTLESLNGKYIYIDLWATWCGPCREQIPFLQKIEEQYKGKNIEFVSISIDAQKDKEKWSKFVTEKQLGGIQLLAENEWESQFLKAYGIFSVPTFILLDPAGNIVNAYAPKPSDDKLIDLFNSLKI